MSTGYECQIRELRPGRWYYVLQRGDCPVGADDWTEHADVVGPYASAAAAEEGLGENEANPGGWTVLRYAPGPRGDALLARAREPWRRGR